ncbi:hypothetical protein AAG906_039667 [Vitis piasezkii]
MRSHTKLQAAICRSFKPNAKVDFSKNPHNFSKTFIVRLQKMIECMWADDEDNESGQTSSSTKGRLEEVLIPRESPSLLNSERNVVIVMDALKDFSREPLQWALNNVIRSGCSITLLGVMPWLPMPYSCKTMSEFWTYHTGDLSQLKEKCEWMNEQKYQKIRGIIELCEEKEVVPYMKVAVGYPLKLVVLEHTTSLHATLVVVDRRLRKYSTFLGKRMPSSVVVMNSDGGVDLLKVQSTIDQGDTTPGETPMTIAPPTPQVILSAELSKLLGFKLRESLVKVYNRIR